MLLADRNFTDQNEKKGARISYVTASIIFIALVQANEIPFIHKAPPSEWAQQGVREMI